MTTTHDVPMPEVVAYRQTVKLQSEPGRIDTFIFPIDEHPKPVGTEDVCLLSDAIAYADARCAKLQAELHVCNHKLKGMDVLSELVDGLRRECVQAEAERDALAEKVKAMEDNDRRYRLLRDPPHMPAVVWIEGRGNQYIDSEWLTGEHADAAIDAATGDEA